MNLAMFWMKSVVKYWNHVIGFIEIPTKIVSSFDSKYPFPSGFVLIRIDVLTSFQAIVDIAEVQSPHSIWRIVVRSSPLSVNLQLKFKYSSINMHCNAVKSKLIWAIEFVSEIKILIKNFHRDSYKIVIIIVL